MSSIVDGQITVLLTQPNTTNLTLSNTLRGSPFTNFYLRGFNVVGANYPTDYQYFVTSNKLQLAHNDCTANPNLGVGATRASNTGNGVILPLTAPNCFYEFNTPIKLRATEFPRWFDIQVKNQNGDLVSPSFTALALYFELK